MGRTCLGCRLGRRWTVATGDQRPSARGFGVDVGKRSWEQEKAGVIRVPPQVPERVVLVWCCGKNLPSSNSPLPNLPRLGIILQKNILERREETLCPWT